MSFRFKAHAIECKHAQTVGTRLLEVIKREVDRITILILIATVAAIGTIARACYGKGLLTILLIIKKTGKEM